MSKKLLALYSLKYNPFWEIADRRTIQDAGRRTFLLAD